jgi:cytochrome oxidase Cu insertion factor (SCO1/SenC/PrrC family)
MRRGYVLAALAAGWTLAACKPHTAAPGPGAGLVQAPAKGGGEGAQAGPGNVGTKAAAFTGTTRDGKPFDLASYRGKTVLVNFFSPG